MLCRCATNAVESIATHKDEKEHKSDATMTNDGKTPTCVDEKRNTSGRQNFGMRRKLAETISVDAIEATAFT